MSNMNLPSNSHRSRIERKKVVKGKVKRKKKSFTKQIAETFIGEEVDSVGAYILNDVVIPAIKATLSDAVQGGIEMLLFGERGSYRGRGSSSRNNKPNISYTSYSKPDRRSAYRPATQRARNIQEVILDSHREAQDVLNSLVDIIDEYGQASVADLNDLIGVSGKYTDNDYGWDNLNTARVRRVREGYLLDLPKTIYLN
jgi:hypothetical protein